MYHIIPIPIIILAVIVYLVSKRYKLTIFATVSKIVIILGVLSFIYLYCAYLGYDILEYIKNIFAF